MNDIFERLAEILNPATATLESLMKNRQYESELDDLEIDEFDPQQIFDL